MPSLMTKIRNSIIANGGVHQEFNQSTLYDYYQSFPATSLGGSLAKAGTSVLGSAGTSVGVQSHADPNHGVCLALAVMCIETRFNWPKFTRLVESAEGKGKARGYMQMQRMIGGLDKSGKKTDSVSEYANVESMRVTSARMHDKKQMINLILGVNFTMGPEIQLGAHANFSDAASKVRNLNDTYVYIQLEGVVGGHAVCMAQTDSHHALFDPNFGLAAFKKKASGSNRAFCIWMQQVLADAYGGKYVRGINLLPFTSKTSKKATIRIG